jgi:hypothetical protein
MEQQQVQSIIRAVGQAVVSNKRDPMPDLPSEASLAVHLLSAFGYRQGFPVTKAHFMILLRAHDFVGRCVQSDWIASEAGQMNVADMRILDWPRVKALFDESFLADDVRAFDNLLA